MENIRRMLGYMVIGLTLWAVDAGAATMNNYCVVPPFIQEIAKPNLLMIIDNSASMNDLAYDDKGYKRCSTTTAQTCAANSDCPSGETCTQARSPYYCFDETFSSASSYVGYFDHARKYQFNFSTNRFQEVASIPSSCALAEVADQVYCKLISDTLHLNIDKTDPTRTKYFYASGKFLNWLTASKFDVEKQVLTGGKYVTRVCSNDSDKACLVDADCGAGNTCNATSAFLQPESRGCVGMGYVKDVNADDFQNFVTGATNPNTDLGLTFLVKGPQNPYNPVAPSTGGQTYLEIFSKSGTLYDYEACQEAIDAIATGTNAEVKQGVENCLASGSPTQGTCQQNSTLSCAASFGPSTPNCDVPVVPAHCSGDATKACTVPTQAADCFISGASLCTTGKIGVVCSANSNCDVKACTLNAVRSCSINGDCAKAEVMGKCSQKTQTSCRTDANCISGGGSINNGPCVGYSAAFNDGTCGVSTAGVCTVTGDLNVGPCIPLSGGYVGPCVFTAQAAATKTKISFSQSMQACWSLRKTPPTPIGSDDINTVKNQCSDIYGSYKTCSNNGYQLCTADADCGTGNTCLDGPDAIQPGNPALMCSTTYEGQMFEKIGGAWLLRSAMPAATPGACLASDSVSDCMKKIHTLFCNVLGAPPVTDPTNPPSANANTENLPAILSGIGVEAQLGAPILTLPVKVETASPPVGLVHEYSNKIRLGLMAFNTFGSSSETSTTVPLPAGKLAPIKVCSNDPTRTCTQPIDCGPGNSCSNAAADPDGAKILSLIGKGHCAAVTTTPCVTAANCSSGQLCSANLCWTPTTTECTKQAHCASTQGCISDGPGSHTETGLINNIDFLRGVTWTPFAEAFYNAIGYFGIDTTDTTGKSSRTDLRLNSADFPDDMNPSEYVCQANNILLITDGSSAADQNSSKTTVVDTYKAISGNVTGTCPKFAGSQDMDDLSWIARHRNINSFSRTVTSTTVPAKKSEAITSYIVFNGSDNGEGGDCNNTTLLTKTANNGGTALLKADIPSQYISTLRKAFEAVAGGTASGTAASILSNSEGSGANILQAVFYPTKDFETESGQPVPTSAAWIGEMQNLWYYVDPFIGNSSVREDTPIALPAIVGDKSLHLVNDYVTEFQFKGGETIAVLKQDTNGDGTGDTVLAAGGADTRVKSQGYCSTASALKCATSAGCPTGETCIIQSIVDADDVSSLWRAGRLLWGRDLSANPKRKLYTHLYGVSATGCTGSFSLNRLVDLVGEWSSLGANDKCIVGKLLQATDLAEAEVILKFVEGYDHSDYGSTITGTINIEGVATKPRSRSVMIGGSKKPWKLGDIITSTPRIQSFNKLNNFHLDAPAGYGDSTYANDSAGNGYANSTAYKGRGMAYAGANDGMLHAFKLGSLSIVGSGLTKATLGNPVTMPATELGHEKWAFIPKNVLPYLKYLADPVYSHLYLVDGPTKLFDASIGYNDNSYIPDTPSPSPRTAYATAGCDATGTGSHTAYWACKKDSATDNNKSWRSILIGSMGIGGASAEFGATCTDCVKNPIAGAGQSSYFALDITDPNNPEYLWEFSHAEMGYATTGAAVARISHKFVDSGITYNDNNGRWFAVVGNGPTGPIDTTYHQFKGKAENPLRVFVLDLKTGTLLRKFDTTYNGTALGNAFAGAMSAAPIDTDRAKKLSDGFYSDDALYFGFARDTTPAAASPTWNGGIMRLLTDESINPDNWSLSILLRNMGPVTTAVSKLQDRKFKELWLFTGTGRYFFKGDDNTAARKILAVKEPCYDKVNDDIYKISTISGQSPRCDAQVVFDADDFADQSTAINSMDGKKGWFIDLAGADNVNNFGAERIITEPVAMPNGAVFFTSFMPSFDICNYGGKSFMWGMKYDTGGTASAGQLKGRALVQVSTGAFEEIDLSTALTASLNRKMTTPMVGKPPTDPPPIVSASGNKPLKRIMHIQEK